MKDLQRFLFYKNKPPMINYILNSCLQVSIRIYLAVIIL